MVLEQYKQDFIEFLVRSKALKFGEFTLKSGRVSPYFINTGMFNDGEKIARLGFFYASKLKEDFDGRFDVLFGPSYKGIPLALSAAIALHEHFGLNKGYAFDRKEAKSHAEKGVIVGSEIKDNDRIIILDDVFTTGGTKEESVALLKSLAKVSIEAVLIAVDRQEVGADGESAIKAFEKKFGIPVKSIATVSEIKGFLHNREVDGEVLVSDEVKKSIEDYLAKYGVKE